MAFDSEFAEALAEIDSDDDLLPAAFTWNGSGYPCVASGAIKGGKLESFGWDVDTNLVLIVRAELFTGSFPEKGHGVVYRGTTYRIDRVLTAPGNSFLRLACVSADRGA